MAGMWVFGMTLEAVVADRSLALDHSALGVSRKGVAYHQGRR
jgi:hypothetical protein